jgi:hypothetical protein
MFNSNDGGTAVTTLKKSLATLGSIAAVGGMLAAPLPAAAQKANPCAPKAKAANPCAGKKAATPCAPAASKAANPCKPANPCAPKK